MKHHGLWMIVGYVAPFLIIFFLPLFGIRAQKRCSLF